nr:Wzz/FepE/Etk N-terminal domain-containing protein [Ferriphaselus amnicola]
MADGDDEIDLLALWAVIWRRRVMIIGATLMSGILAAGISLMMPNIYRAEILIAPASDADSGKSAASSALSQFGGLASLAGISIGNSSSVEENLAVLNSRTFLWKFIQDNELMPILYVDEWDSVRKGWKNTNSREQPSLWDAFRLLTKDGVLGVDRGKKDDLITVSVEWGNPEVASKLANTLIVQLNEYLRQRAVQSSQRNLQYLNEALGKTQVQEVRQSLFELISKEQKKAMLASADGEFAFKVLDASSTPDQKVKPKRALIVLLASLLGCFIAVLLAVISDGVRSVNRKACEPYG